MLSTVVTVATVCDRLSSDPDPIDELREQFPCGAIDETEFEQQVAFYDHARNKQIRIVVEDVPGIAAKTSKAIVREYDSREDLRQTDRECLKSVRGVGE